MSVILYPGTRNFRGQITSLGTQEVFNTITATTHRSAFIVRAPRSGTLTHVGFSTGAVTVAATIQVRLETMPQGQFSPTGTLYHANATGSQSSPAANTYYRVPINGGAGVSVTAGDWIPVVLSCPSGSPNLTLAVSRGSNAINLQIQTAFFNGTNWVDRRFGTTPVQFEFSDAPTTPNMGSLPISLLNYPLMYLNSTNAVTGDECGMRISLPFAARCRGITGRILEQNKGQLSLYSGTTLLRSAQFDYYTSSFRNVIEMTVPFAPIDLEPGDYIVAMKPLSNSEEMGVQIATPFLPSWRTALGFGEGDRFVSRVDNGAWTVDDTRVTPMAIEIQQIMTANSGIGGRRRPLIIGA